MARYEVSRRARKGGHVFENVNTLAEVKSLTAGTEGLLITDRRTGVFFKSENIEFWAKDEDELNPVKTRNFARAIIKSSYAKLS